MDCDFTSSAFDPLLALSSNIEPPTADTAPLDNIAKCRALLPSSMPESLSHVEKAKANEDAKARAQSFKERAQSMEERVRLSCNMSMQTVLSHVRPGPVRLLTGLMGARVRVLTKHARGLRGEAIGTLIAYDKFVNVVMRDVEEKYQVRIMVEKSGGGRRPKLDPRKRSLPLALIKGDSIVCISAAKPIDPS